VSTFLLVYDRRAGKLLLLREFGEEQRELATSERLGAERQFGSDREVVLLEAKSVEDLHKTHARYFGQSELRNLASTASGGKVIVSGAVDLKIHGVGEQ
jgi:hypothetical protein